MPPEEYSPLQQLLLDPELHVVKALADVCHLDRVPLANSLLRIFRYKLFYNIIYHHKCISLFLFLSLDIIDFLGMKEKKRIFCDH